MSRIGRNPIHIPSNVQVSVDKDNNIKVSGPLGSLEQLVDRCIKINIENNVITFLRNSEANDVKAKHGLYRALVNNMVKGVTAGFSKVLVIKGVGYKLNKTGKVLTMNIGFSHPITIEEEDGIKIEIPSQTEIKISGIDRQKVGQFAAKIKDFKKVEPYHGYGIRYSDEVVIKKQGKTSGKGKK